MKEDIVLMLMQIQNQFKILHWQTTSYARHMAYGLTYDTISDLSDRFIEAYQGRYGRLKADKSVEFANISDGELNSFLDEALEFLMSLEKLDIKDKDADLLTIRDEVVEAINKLKYLLTLE